MSLLLNCVVPMSKHETILRTALSIDQLFIRITDISRMSTIVFTFKKRCMFSTSLGTRKFEYIQRAATTIASVVVISYVKRPAKWI